MYGTNTCSRTSYLNGTNNCSRTIYFQTGLELSASLSMTGPKPIKQVDLFSKINKN